LKTHYPGIVRKHCIDDRSCLETVEKGDAFAYLGHLAALSEALRQPEFSGLKIVGASEFMVQHHMGLAPGNKIALSIIDKALRAITPRQRQSMQDRWFAVRFESGTDYQLMWRTLGGAALLLVIAAIWIRYQSRLNRKLSAAIAEARQVHELSAELEFYFRESTDLLCLTDMQGNILRYNPQWEKTLGYSDKQLEGVSLLDLTHPDDRKATHDKLETLAHLEPINDFSNRISNASGEYRWLEWRSVPTRTGKIVAAARDITDRRAAQREKELLFRRIKQKNEELERFSYTVSHDLRAPLVTIQGFAAEIANDLQANDLDSIPESIERIQQAAHRMALLMQGLLQIARLGKEVGHFQSVSLAQVLAEVQELLHGLFRVHQVEIRTIGPLPVIQGDPLRMRELLQNLCENATKYRHPDRPPIITISADDVGSFWVVHIEDNGIGIPPEKQETIFDIFTQLDKRSNGAGVGLALVKRIAELHGGTVKVRSDENMQGSIFDLYLPKEIQLPTG